MVLCIRMYLRKAFSSMGVRGQRLIPFSDAFTVALIRSWIIGEAAQTPPSTSRLPTLQVLDFSCDAQCRLQYGIFLKFKNSQLIPNLGFFLVYKSRHLPVHSMISMLGNVDAEFTVPGK